MPYTSLLYHIIVATKGRVPAIAPELKPRLYEYIGGILRNLDSVLLDANGIEDHVHLLVSLHPSRSVSDAMRLVKSNSSKWVHETFPECQDFWWQREYSAFSVSKSAVPEVKKYLARQVEHHRSVTLEEELATFLAKYEIAYKPQYLLE